MALVITKETTDSIRRRQLVVSKPTTAPFKARSGVATLLGTIPFPTVKTAFEGLVFFNFYLDCDQQKINYLIPVMKISQII